MEGIVNAPQLEAAAAPRVDRLARLAARLLDATTAVLFVRERSGVRVVAAHGLTRAQEEAISGYELFDDLLVVPDLAKATPSATATWARLDARAQALALAPVRRETGAAVGALVVVASQPKRWSHAHLSQLEELAALGGEILAMSTSSPDAPNEPSASTTAGARSGAYRTVACGMPPPARGSSARKARVLVVDGHRYSRGSIARVVRGAGFDVAEAQDEPGALARVGFLEPALVVVDTTTPGLDGSRLIRELRRRDSDRRLGILAVGAGAHGGERRDLLAAGAHGYVATPFRDEDLLGHVERLLAGADAGDGPSPRSRQLERQAIAALTDRCRRALPTRVRREIRGAARAADYDLLVELLVRLHEADGSLVEPLRSLVDSSAYDVLEAVMVD
jgi:CheY-like chemotaxis protein